MPEPKIAIIGGGFCGTALAIHLAEMGGFAIDLYEPREQIGRGLAYGSENHMHRINVPSHRMSLYPDQPNHFADYLKEHPPQDDPDLLGPNGDPFPRRKVFGDYIHAQALPHLREGRIRHIQSRVLDMQRKGAAWHILSEDGDDTQADIVILAASHPAAGLPKALKPVANDPRLLREGNKIDTNARVLVIGTGLSAADEIASLLSISHRGPITAISRRGLRSRGHAKAAGTWDFDFRNNGQSALTLLRKTRAQIAHALAKGGEWQPVFDQLRAQGQALWRDLSLKHRRQIIRHLRPYWDVHRFRIAPQLEALLDQALTKGQLRLFAAHILEADPSGNHVTVTLKPKRQPPFAQNFDAIVVTTGPDHGRILESQPLFKSLAQQGVISACPTGLGIACDDNSQALSANGEPSQALYICGPLARGTFGELMGLPQVAQQPQTLANHLRQLAHKRQSMKV